VVVRAQSLRCKLAWCRESCCPSFNRLSEITKDLDPVRAFSEPIIRGDVETVSAHLQALRSQPAARVVYGALAKAALEYLATANRCGLAPLFETGNGSGPELRRAAREQRGQ
jgi:hypothetical protein